MRACLLAVAIAVLVPSLAWARPGAFDPTFGKAGYVVGAEPGPGKVISASRRTVVALAGDELVRYDGRGRRRKVLADQVLAAVPAGRDIAVLAGTTEDDSTALEVQRLTIGGRLRRSFGVGGRVALPILPNEGWETVRLFADRTGRLILLARILTRRADGELAGRGQPVALRLFRAGRIDGRWSRAATAALRERGVEGCDGVFLPDGAAVLYCSDFNFSSHVFALTPRGRSRAWRGVSGKLVVAPDGRLLAFGRRGLTVLRRDGRTVRLLAPLRLSWWAGGIDAVGFDDRGRILVAFDRWTPQRWPGGLAVIKRLDAHGRPDRAFGTRAVPPPRNNWTGTSVSSIRVDADGRIVLGGYALDADLPPRGVAFGNWRPMLVRLLP